MAVENDALAAVDEIVRLYNAADVAGVVDRYWANTTVTVNGRTIATGGRDVLAGELAVLSAAPDRRLRIRNAVANGRVVAVEATLSFTDRASGAAKEAHWSAFWTFADDGSITTDNAYFDPADWPTVPADPTT
jgi:hypothetical protein